MNRVLTTAIAIAVLVCLPGTHASAAGNPDQNKESVIIEVSGNPDKHKSYLNTYHPFIDVVETYDTLFNGLALKAEPDRFKKLESLSFIKALHPVAAYETQAAPLNQNVPLNQADPSNQIDHSKQTGSANRITSLKQGEDSVIPGTLNTTSFTGKGVQVAVVDTGIDYNHPDLAQSFAGGYDLVDLDNDPMETTASEGIPTRHGSHVAGIIAADGKLKGVAPDASIHAYRALGPGGMGTSVQVIAALEQAVNDGADVINLSLGNTVNTPDFPTSVAVNRARALGVPVVTANGNDGPENWTIGSPATAANALSAGAVSSPQTVPFLVDTLNNKRIPLLEMNGSKPWNMTKSYDMTVFNGQNASGKIALMKRGKTPFFEMVKQAQAAGAVAAVIYNNESGRFQGAIQNTETPLNIPVASISKQAGEWLVQNIKNETSYMKTTHETAKRTIADFSSRGPVTVNWDLKPEVSAPGTNILSTVPGGYQELQGTSMAAPHVTGAIALLMEAHPGWSAEQITGALKTTANRIKNEQGVPLAPIIQGAGSIQPKKAVSAGTIIDEPLLSFGKAEGFNDKKTADITIQNQSDHKETYNFSVPAKQTGLSWHLPMSFTLDAGETKNLPIVLSINSKQTDKGLHQGWLTLNRDDAQYQLPYLFISETADYPRAMGFDFSLEPFSGDKFTYQFYLAEEAKSVDVMLYNPDTLVYERTLLQTTDVQVGLNKGKLAQSELGKPGQYLAVINVKLKNGDMSGYQTKIHIPK